MSIRAGGRTDGLEPAFDPAHRALATSTGRRLVCQSGHAVVKRQCGVLAVERFAGVGHDTAGLLVERGLGKVRSAGSSLPAR